MAALKVKKVAKKPDKVNGVKKSNGEGHPLIDKLSEDSVSLRRLYHSYQDIPNVSRAIGGAIQEMEREVNKLKRDMNS